jgi:hypothetical protein
MPGPDSGDGERRDGQLPRILFWAGVGLAPLAMLLLLLGRGGGALRFAAVLAVLAVVLIGVSITLRGDAEAVRQELEETLFEEIDALRKDVRDDVTTAARATHRAFGEKLQVLYDQVNALRAELEAARGYNRPAPGTAAGAGVPAATPSAPLGYAAQGGRGGVPGGVVRHTETVQVTTRHTVVDPHRDDPPREGGVYGGAGGTVYGAGRHASEPVAVPRQRSGEWAAPDPAPARRRAVEPDAGTWTDPGRAARDWSDAGRAARDWSDPGRAARDWSDPGRTSGGSWPAFERATPSPGSDRGTGGSWTDPARNGGESWDATPGGAGEYRSSRSTGLEEDSGEWRWSGVQAGDRWATARADDRGRELRMGERRAAVDADGSGTQFRIEDRWAAVRQTGSRADDSWTDPGSTPWGEGPSTGRTDAGRRSDRDLPALPAGGVDNAALWDRGWAQPDREPAGRRRAEEWRYGADPDDGPWAGPRRQVDRRDDRWR